MADDKDDIERRRFFRIEDEICLEITVVTEQEYGNAQQDLTKTQQTAFSLSANFATMNHDYLPMMNSIRSAYPEIAQYLDLINRKMDSLSQHLLDEELPCADNNKHKVNISASGIALDSTQSYSINQPLKLRLVLLPEKIGLELYGRVVNTQAASGTDDKTHISIDFEFLRNEDQELLIRHNLNKQMQELREKSGNN